jgi:hypothetical protein
MAITPFAVPIVVLCVTTPSHGWNFILWLLDDLDVPYYIR